MMQQSIQTQCSQKPYPTEFYIYIRDRLKEKAEYCAGRYIINKRYAKEVISYAKTEASFPVRIWQPNKIEQKFILADMQRMGLVRIIRFCFIEII